MRLRVFLALALTVVLGLWVFQNSGLAQGSHAIGLQSAQQQSTVTAALGWLRSQQNTDGGFGSPSSDVARSAEVALGVAAANDDPADWTNGGVGLIDYLATNAAAYSAQTAGKAAKLALAATAANRDPMDFGDVDLIAAIQAFYNSAQHTYGASYSAYDQAYALLALRAAFASLPPEAVQKLRSAQNGDGGWGYTDGLASDTNATSLAIQALAAAGEGVSSATMISATHYLTTVQNVDGGFPYQHSDPPPWAGANDSDCDSTAYVIHALLALHSDPYGSLWTSHGPGPVEALLSFKSASGAFTYYGADDALATKDALQALMGKPYPVWGRVMGAKKGMAWLQTLQNADGGFAAFGSSSSAGDTVDVVLAAVSVGQDPNALRLTTGQTPLLFLRSQASAYCTSAMNTGKLIVGVVAAPGNPNSFGGVNLKQRLASFYDAGTGSYETTNGVKDQAWAILALKALGQPVPASAVMHLKDLRRANGSWAEPFGDAAYGTGIALQALKAAGESSGSAYYADALGWLQDTLENNDGGFPQDNPALTPWGSPGLGHELDGPVDHGDFGRERRSRRLAVDPAIVRDAGHHPTGARPGVFRPANAESVRGV